MNSPEWHQLHAEEAISRLGSSASGLDSTEIKTRLTKYGHNEIIAKKRSALIRLLAQFNNPLLYVLMAAAAAGLVLHFIMDADTLTDTWVILGVIVATAVIGFIQEGKAESSLEALKKMIVSESTVIRDGKRKSVPTREIVPGDVVVLEEGDRVPADLRLFSVKELFVEEAALTGESLPIGKNPDKLDKPDLSPGDQLNMAFSGTFVARGRGQGVVTATGENTVLGRIARIMQGTRKITPPIMRKISAFTRVIIIICIAFGVINFIMGTLLGYEFAYMLLAAVAVIVAMIPEGLAGAIIAAFAVGSIAMAKRNALIKRLPAAETLGNTTVICSDKTGTLTRNEMTVQRIYAGGKDYHLTGTGYEPEGKIVFYDSELNDLKEHPALAGTLRAGIHCNNAQLYETENGYSIKGDPTEGALVVSAFKAGLQADFERLDEIPFSSELRYMATLHKNNSGLMIYVKGSPERIIAMCRDQMDQSGVGPLQHSEIQKKISEMAREALRVIGFAFKFSESGSGSLKSENLSGLTFLGLQGMLDPPRPEAIEAVRACKQAGVRVVMITGDHVETARAVAQQLGITGADGRAVSGEELEQTNDEELRSMVEKVSVYARVAPEHKFRIVDSLQKNGEIVAVTGDGVNDAPALKRADIGIAMGINGTEVSKEASDMVLADDNFASIVAAEEEGRHVFTNIWKVILYLLPTNGGQGLVLIGAVFLSPFIPVFALRLPIEPVQILWVNLIVAIGCSIPLIWEIKEKGLLNRPPRDPEERLFNPVFIRKVVIVSFISAAAVFGVFLAFIGQTGSEEPFLAQAQTAAFTTLIIVQLFYLFTARSIDHSAFSINPFSNKYLVIGAAATLVLQILIVYAEPLFGISPFRTSPFPPVWWIPIILAAVVGFLAIELEKLLVKKLKGRYHRFS